MKKIVFTISVGMLVIFLAGSTTSKPASDINAKVAQISNGPADFNDVIAIFGQPSDYSWGKESFKLEDLPVERYWVWYPDSIHILMNWNVAVRLEIVDPAYVFDDKVPMGSSLERVISTVGHPKEIVVGRQGWEDGILYKDINGQVGWCQYTRKDLSADFRFLNYTLNCIHIFLEVKSSSVTGNKAPMRGSKLDETATSPKPVSDINAKVAQVDIGTTTLDDVIRIFGEPAKYLWGQQTFTKDTLPSIYIAEYPNRFHVVVSYGKVDELRFEGADSGFIFKNKIKIGSSLEEVLDVIGQPEEIIIGQSCDYRDGILYKDIKGRRGHCYYSRRDQGVRMFFGNYEVAGLYLTSSKPTKRVSFQTVKTIKSVNEFDDVRWKDMSKLDLSDRKGLIATLTFNQKTLWPGPAKMPNGCDPGEILTEAMNPGLGVRELHKQGITGKGVNVAIIDQPMYLDHPEFAGKILKYYDTGCGSQSSMHGPAVASLLVGTNCGTAPGARVYYAAVPSWKRDTAYEAKALNWIIEENKDLPVSQKIRVVSVSAAPSSPNVRDKNQHMWAQARARAEADGIMVLDCTSEYGFIGRCWYNARSPESVRRCTPGDPRYDFNITDHLLVPSAPRTTAEEYEKGDFNYQYCGYGGLSWSIPYAAGVLALGWQIRPDLTPEQMRELLFKSAYEKSKGLNVKVSNAKEFFRSASERKKKGEEIGKPQRSIQRVRHRDGNGAKIINPEKFIRLVRRAKATRKTNRRL